MTHWKEQATRCAVVGCERTRRKGWSTCPLHNRHGKSLYGAGRIAPIELHEPEDYCPYCGKPEGGLTCDDDHCRER